MHSNKKPQQPASKPPQGKPQTKEDAIRQMMEKDPERAAQLIREFLKGK